MPYNKSLLFTLLLSPLYHVQAIANDTTPWEINLAGGTAELNAQDFTTNIYPDLLISSDKNQQKNADDWKAWTIQAGVGYRFYLWDAKRYSDEIQWLPLLIPQINFYYLKGNVNGRVDKYYEYPMDPDCDVDYSVGVSSSRVMADLNLMFVSWRNYSLYGKAGIGPSWNRVDYRSKEGAASEEIHLNPQTDTNFAYEFGGGARVAITQHVGLSLEYLYTGFTHLDLNNKGTLEGTGDLDDVDSDHFNLSSQAVLLGVDVNF